MVGVNFSSINLLVGEKYWSPLKNWSLFTVFFFTDKVFDDLNAKFEQVQQFSLCFINKLVQLLKYSTIRIRYAKYAVFQTKNIEVRMRKKEKQGNPQQSSSLPAKLLGCKFTK